ncbi:MAG: AI-2E family transporter [bacterium]
MQSRDVQPEVDPIDTPSAVTFAAWVVSGAFALVFCHYTRSILVPIVMAIFLSYVLSPFVEALSRLRFPGTQIRFPRSASVMLVVLIALTLVLFLGLFIVDETTQFLSEIPKYQDTIADSITHIRTKFVSWQQYATTYLEPIRGEQVAIDVAADQQRLQQILERGNTDVWTSVSNYIFGSITSLLEFTSQVLMCLFVLFFVLLEGPVLRTKVINIVGTSLRGRRIALEIMRNVNEDVQRYLFNRVATNLVLGVAVGLVYFAFGLKYAFLLGVIAGIFNFVPYVGPIVGSVFPVLAAYIQFGDWTQVLWVLGAYTLLTGLEGNIITPIVLGRHLKLNSLAVLLACVFWGWIWGPIGLFLAVPIMAVFKAMAEHIDTMRPAGELLRG